jgi:hypothetical protein
VNAPTLKALRASIAHWERMRDDPVCGEEPYDVECPLCALFEGVSECAAECPIKEKTGRDDCYGSQWMDAEVAWCSVTGMPNDVHRSAWRKQANRMLRFLRGLLPKPKKRKK